MERCSAGGSNCDGTGGRKRELPAVLIQLPVREAEGVAGEKHRPFCRVAHHDVMARMARRSPERGVRAPRCRSVAPSGVSITRPARNRQDLAVDAPGLLDAVDRHCRQRGDGSGSMTCAAHHAGAPSGAHSGKRAINWPGAAGMIEMYVREDHVIHLLPAPRLWPASAASTWGTACEVPVSITAARPSSINRWIAVCRRRS